jgi:hypothetical protein
MAFRSKYCQMLIKTERIDKEERLLMLWVPGSHYLVAIIFDRSNCPRHSARSENFELKNSTKKRQEHIKISSNFKEVKDILRVLVQVIR